jgi:hypothetical protein
VVMHNVGEALIDRFLADYLAWWRSVSPLGEIAARPAMVM